MDGGFAGFDGDALNFDGLGEDCFLKAVGQDFQHVADFGEFRFWSQNVHGLGLILIHGDVRRHALGLFGRAVF